MSTLKGHFTQTPSDAGDVMDAADEVVKLIIVRWAAGFVSLWLDGRRSPPRWKRLGNNVTVPISCSGAKGVRVVRGGIRCESCDENECQVEQDGLGGPCLRHAWLNFSAYTHVIETL